MERQYGNWYRNLFGTGAVLLCILLLLILLRFPPSGVQAQSDTGRDEFEQRMQTFFDAVARSSSASALSELLRSSPLGSPDASEQLAELQRGVEELEKQFGAVLNWEKLDTTKRIGNNIAVVRYVLMYEQYPVVWTFTFYRKPSLTSGSNPWVLVELHFDTNMRSLL